MSSSSSSNRPAALGALLWIFLIIGAAGLVITMLSVAGATSTGSAIGIILLLVGIVGAVVFAYISSYFSAAAPATEAAIAPALAAEAPSAEAPPAEAPVAEAPVAEAVIVETPAGEALLVEEVVAETPTGELLLVEEVVAEVPVAEAMIVEAPVAATFSSEPASLPQTGFNFVSHTQSFNWRGAGAPGTEEWVFSLASSPTVTHTYRVTAREGSSSSAWYPGGGIVDIMIDSVPTGQLMVVPNEKKTREDVAGGNLYRLEMEITSDGLAPATIATSVTVNGVALE